MATLPSRWTLDPLIVPSYIPKSFQAYAQVRAACLHQHDDAPSLQDIIKEYAKFAARGINDVRASAEAGNPADCIELGLRCGMAYSLAYPVLLSLSDSTLGSQLGKIPLRLPYAGIV